MDDLISRQAMLDGIDKLIKIHFDRTVVLYKARKVAEDLPSAQPEPEAISEWKKEFREYVDSLDITRDDWKGIIEYIGELPSAQLNHNAEVSKMGIVHCEDCEHWDTSWETAYGLHYCPMIDMSTKKNFFCKYGAEKRGEIDETD